MTNSGHGQSRLHSGNKFILVGDCVRKIRLNFASKSRKSIFLQKTLEPPSNGIMVVFKGSKKVLMLHSVASMGRPS